MRYYFLISLLFLAFTGYGQVGQWAMNGERGDYFRSYSSTVVSNTSYTLTTDFPFKAVVIKYPSDLTPDNVAVSLDGENYLLAEDPHWAEDSKSTALLTLDNEHFGLDLYTGSLTGLIEVHLINGSYDKGSNNLRKEGNEKTETCDEPESVPQSVWREGLDLPNTSRSFTNVKHLIVHHSAGTNTSSDWVEVVRSIFIFHTETRGWSDIGYNYLIDPEGVLYKGRDPVGGAQDDVIGAHFCGKNSGTMGTCLLGTYTSVPPTDDAVSTLESLLAWKADKESLNVFASATHSGSTLKHIAGHRDGCSTECPGQMTWEMLPAIRTETNTLMEPCGSSSEPVDPVDPVTFLTVFPNPVLGSEFIVHVPLQYRQVRMVSALGENVIDMILDKEETEVAFQVSDLQSGLYTLVFQGKTSVKTAKLIIAH